LITEDSRVYSIRLAGRVNPPVTEGLSRMSFDPAGSGRILDAALPQFAEHGYEHTTLDAVGAAAGLDRPSVELLFPTKATLFAVLVNRELDRVRTQVIESVPTDAGDAPVGTAVARAVEALMARIRADGMSWRLLLQADFGSFGERYAREELRDVLRCRLRWLIGSAAPLEGEAGEAVAELLGTLLAAMVELSIDPLLAGDPAMSPTTLERGLRGLFAAGKAPRRFN
jgi:AcrR family transcriptional regulator